VFVADKEKDLSAGTLYVAKVGAGFSIDPAAAAAPLTWIKLGSATSAEIENLANTLKPTDIMTVSATDPALAHPPTPATPRSRPTARVEWVKLKSGMEKAAAFLETHRYCAWWARRWASPRWKALPSTSRTRWPTRRCRTCQDSMVAGNAANVPGNGISIPKLWSRRVA
jgi:hypothetical protein